MPIGRFDHHGELVPRTVLIVGADRTDVEIIFREFGEIGEGGSVGRENRFSACSTRKAFGAILHLPACGLTVLRPTKMHSGGFHSRYDIGHHTAVAILTYQEVESGIE